jgi:hypothetical protein
MRDQSDAGSKIEMQTLFGVWVYMEYKLILFLCDIYKHFLKFWSHWMRVLMLQEQKVKSKWVDFAKFD